MIMFNLFYSTINQSFILTFKLGTSKNCIPKPQEPHHKGLTRGGIRNFRLVFPYMFHNKNVQLFLGKA